MLGNFADDLPHDLLNDMEKLEMSRHHQQRTNENRLSGGGLYTWAEERYAEAGRKKIFKTIFSGLDDT